MERGVDFGDADERIAAPLLIYAKAKSYLIHILAKIAMQG